MFSDKHSQETALASLKNTLDAGVSQADLARLANSEEALVRATVAAHPHTSVLALLRLADDEAATVRAGVARNPRPDVPEDIHERLAADPRPEVKLALAGNPAISRAVLDRLARSRDRDVAFVARSRVAEQGGARGLIAKMSIPRG
ncbi:hypothetical protein [Demequina zhanjiangensis]|uniref:Leucine rich repeat variant n=1 Tax=Demequina zhanjiangensis TaxID=3051659 RepID=A0ABT8G4M4_9MICO|nr:hypothetical protein [Demequina sp. SYSU T00b26]MDN4474068.1 hypothetical protein [Demequina sp. SYSU T00b26]